MLQYGGGGNIAETRLDAQFARRAQRNQLGRVVAERIEHHLWGEVGGGLVRLRLPIG